MTPVIELRGVGKRYRRLQEEAMLLRSLLPFARRTPIETWALRDVDVGLPAGRVVAFVGENGAGKTTLMKLLCRFYDPTEGRILVDGVDLRDPRRG